MGSSEGDGWCASCGEPHWKCKCKCQSGCGACASRAAQGLGLCYVHAMEEARGRSGKDAGAGEGSRHAREEGQWTPEARHANIGAGGGDDDGYIHPDVLAQQTPEVQAQYAARGTRFAKSSGRKLGEGSTDPVLCDACGRDLATEVGSRTDKAQAEEIALLKDAAWQVCKSHLDFVSDEERDEAIDHLWHLVEGWTGVPMSAAQRAANAVPKWEGDPLWSEESRAHLSAVAEKIVAIVAPEANAEPVQGSWPTSDEGRTHARLTDLVDQNLGYRPTMTIDKLLGVLEEHLPTLAKVYGNVNDCVHDFHTIESDDQAGESLEKCRECGLEMTFRLRPETAMHQPTITRNAASPEPVCECGHVRDEHDFSGGGNAPDCQVDGCDCIHFTRDPGATPTGGTDT